VAQRNHLLGFPNLVKGRALRSLYCRFRCCAKAAQLSCYQVDGAWNVISRMPLDKALAIDDATMLMKRPQNYATIRLDEKLRDRIKKLAEAEHRTFMGEVAVLLEEALANRDKSR